MQDTVEAMLTSRQSTLLLDRVLLGSPFVYHRALVAVSLAGRVATKFSVKKSPRLRQALEHDASPRIPSTFSALQRSRPALRRAIVDDL